MEPPAPRMLRLGQVVIRDGNVTFEPEAAEPRFRARPGEDVALAVGFDYMEASGVRERVQVEAEAEVDGRLVGRSEARIKDRPFLVDDQRGTLAIPLRVEAGMAGGVVHVRALYRAERWGRGVDKEAPLHVSVPFALDVG